MLLAWASYTQHTRLLIFNTELLDLDEDLGDYERQEERLKKIAPKIQEEW